MNDYEANGTPPPADQGPRAPYYKIKLEKVHVVHLFNPGRRSVDELN